MSLKHHISIQLLGALIGVHLVSSCRVNRFIPEGEYLLEKVRIESDSNAVSPLSLEGYVRQHPNSKWFSFIPVPLGFYSLSGRDSTKKMNKLLRRMGEAPVIYSPDLTEKTRRNMELAVQNMGYLHANVDVLEQTKKNRIKLKYQIHPRERYKVRRVDYEIQDTALGRVLVDEGYETSLFDGMDFDLNKLNAERSQMSSFLADRGYYRFNKDFIRFEADSTQEDKQVDLRMIVSPYRSTEGGAERPHQVYSIGKVNYANAINTEKLFVRESVIHKASELREGDIYSESKLRDTYSGMNRLGAVMSTNVRLTPDETDSTRLNALVQLSPAKRNSFSVELEGTNAAGDFGAAFSTTYQNRNIFRGSEMFNIKLRGAFEAIKGLKGYQDQNYIEYGVETSLTFPDLKFPFVSENFKRRARATSELSLMFESQDRPEFHRRVLTAAWKYRWSRQYRQRQHRIDLLDVNYVFMPWISPTFRKLYLDDPENRNAILRYNYENLFIIKTGYNFTYSSIPNLSTPSNYGTNAYILRFGIETSGNLIYALSRALSTNTNSLGQYTLFNIAFAEYAKFDFDFSKSFLINEHNSVALHFGLGIAYPYGNSTILPYEKRYFSGGANSVRGWSVRGLGPGSFQGNDGRIDFINQTGDLKLDMNMEYRTHLFWKLDGAFFVDAGNIWTLRNYSDQPGGQFKFNSFFREIAVAYGLGLRLNFQYFILRLDGGMKAIHPAYTDSRRHYPIAHPNFSRDFNLHFSVGLPF